MQPRGLGWIAARVTGARLVQEKRVAGHHGGRTLSDFIRL